MSNPKLKPISIHSYKHSGELYRRWDKPVILEETDEFLILINDKITISNSKDPITKRTKDPAVWILPKGKWYNVIVNERPGGISTYINIASPYIIEEGALKYIDYDLDVKVFMNNKIKLLDQKEYAENKVRYSYPPKLNKIIEETTRNIMKELEKNGHPFTRKFINEKLKLYKELKKADS